MRIVFLDESTANLNGDLDLTSIHQIGDLITYPLTRTEDEAISRSEQADYLIVNKVLITRNVV